MIKLIRATSISIITPFFVKSIYSPTLHLQDLYFYFIFFSGTGSHSFRHTDAVYHSCSSALGSMLLSLPGRLARATARPEIFFFFFKFCETESLFATKSRHK